MSVNYDYEEKHTNTVDNFIDDFVNHNNDIQTSVEDLSKILRDHYGMEPHGNEIMYNGYTGRMMETSIFQSSFCCQF